MIAFSSVCKNYLQGRSALQNVSFTIHKGEMVYLTGHSGAGKSTLLRLIAAMERATVGTIYVNGQDITNLSKAQIPYLRRCVSMIFQDHHLVMERTVAENVALPLLVRGMSYDQILLHVKDVLKKVGLLSKINCYPITLSVGEQQRVGIARAIIAKPAVLLADEPTGNLDRQLSHDILRLFNQLNEEGMTIVMATHDIDLISKYPHRTIRLQAGCVITDNMLDPKDYYVV